MTYGDIVDVLTAYRRPGSPSFQRHFQRLPAELTNAEHVPMLLEILGDAELPPRVREHAAGALGETGDRNAVPALIDALGDRRLRRGAAVALGRLCDRRAADALQPLADGGEGAARWALLQVAPPTDVDTVMARLEGGHLRDIRPTLAGLDEGCTRAVSAAIVARLGVVDAAELNYDDHGWMVTALQYAPGPEVEPVLVRIVEACRDGWAPNLCHRTLRALGSLAPLAAIRPLVELAAALTTPGHVQSTAVCLEKILKRHGDEARRRLRQAIPNLRATLEAWRRATAEITPETPNRPWDHSPGTPGWFAEAKRARSALTRLLRQLDETPPPRP